MPAKFLFDPEERKLQFRHDGLKQEAYYREYAQQMADIEPARKTERMLKIVEFANKLGDAGFDVEVSSWQTAYFTFTIDRKDLPKVYKALGHLKVHAKDVENVRKRLLNVFLTAESFPDYCQVKYQKKMPRGSVTDGGEAQKDGAKCKLVRKVTPRKVEYVLECAR